MDEVMDIGTSGETVSLDWQRVLDTLADPIVASDVSGRIIYANRATEALLGWHASELIGQPLTVIQPERFRAAHLAGFHRYITTGESRILGHSVRIPALHRNGTELDIELAISAIPTANGQVIVASLRDLRDRVELERQLAVTEYLRATTAAAGRLTSLLDSEAVMTTVAETLVDSFDAVLARVWIAEASSGMLSLRAEASSGYRPSVARQIALDSAALPIWLDSVAQRKEVFLRNDVAGDRYVDHEWMAAGGITSIAAFPLLFAGELQGIMVVFGWRPFSEELIEVLSSFAVLASSSLHGVQLFAREQAARDEFLSTMSHDLRNPITALKGRTQVLLRRLDRLPAEERETFARHLESMDATSDKMDRLIGELVEVTRQRMTQPFALRRGPVDLIRLVRQVTADGAQGSDRHTITVESDGSTLIGEWDETRLDRVLTNLLANAIKYSPAGGEIVVRLSQEQRPSGAVARIAVQDQGLGIPVVDLPHIFERFFRAGNVTTSIAGSGIGLAGAQQIVAMHGGTLSVESVEGAGSTFIVELPLP